MHLSTFEEENLKLHRFQFVFDNLTLSTLLMSIATWLDPKYKIKLLQKSGGNSSKFKLNYPIIHICIIDKAFLSRLKKLLNQKYLSSRSNK